MNKQSTPKHKLPQPPPLTLPPGATDEDRYLWLLGTVANGIFSQFEIPTALDVHPSYQYLDADDDDDGTYDRWESARTKHLAQRSAMAAMDLLEQFDTYRCSKAIGNNGDHKS